MTTLDDRPRIHGPYPDSVALAMAVEDVYRASRLLAPDGPMQALEQINAGLILGALREAHVEIGARERGIVGVLSEIGPEYVAVLCGWIERAGAASQGVLLAELARHRAVLAEVGLVMVRCCGWECSATAALPVGSTFLCPEHGGCAGTITRGVAGE